MLRSTLHRSLRLTQLGLNRVATRGLGALRRQARNIEIRLDSVDQLQISPFKPLPFARSDLGSLADPIPSIVDDAQFETTTRYFADDPASRRALVSATSQAVLYTLLRNLAQGDALEIGTYKAATTEAMCRAVAANGSGMVHAVDPFRGEYIAAVLKRWPDILRKHVTFHDADSMSFFFDLPKLGVRPILALIDGNHDYEFALFDIQSAARHLVPGGFIVIDNVSLPGPFAAARRFVADSPGWIECGGTTSDRDAMLAFDQRRSVIRDTDFIILRAPRGYRVDNQPRHFLLTRQLSNRVEGIRLTLAEPAAQGVLHVQTMLHAYGASAAEAIASQTLRIDSASGTITVRFDAPLRVDGAFAYFTVEPWLSWQSDRPLLLSEPPQPF
jgi:predicted O-methyltransferase YrrM